mgnify:FL=1
MTEPVLLRAPLRIDAVHPSLPGHFPGHPVVPGVVLLDRIAAMVEAAGLGRLARIRSVKFLVPLLPMQEAEVVVACTAGGGLRFRIERDGGTILVGEGESA